MKAMAAGWYRRAAEMKGRKRALFGVDCSHWVVALTIAGGCTPLHESAGSPREQPGREAAIRGGEPEAEATAAIAAGREGGSALALLAALPVRERAARSGYARDQFGPAWKDVDRNGCDTRNDILKRDLDVVAVEGGARHCTVEAGRLADPYTGATIKFERGSVSRIDIDHVVALGNAWMTGAAGWPIEKRLELANDPLNLLAVDAGANRAKGDGDAAEWLPPRASFRCAYVARQIAVKAKYGLWVTPAEREAMHAVLKTCPEQPAPTSEAPVTGPREEADSRGAAESRHPAPPNKSRPAGAVDPDYGSCKEAKARGKGPYRRGRDPEYDYYQDRDGDGVVCE